MVSSAAGQMMRSEAQQMGSLPDAFSRFTARRGVQKHISDNGTNFLAAGSVRLLMVWASIKYNMHTRRFNGSFYHNMHHTWLECGKGCFVRGK